LVFCATLWRFHRVVGAPDLFSTSPTKNFNKKEESVVLNVTGLGELEQVLAPVVTDGILPIIGDPPTLGRLFTRADDSPASADTVMPEESA